MKKHMLRALAVWLAAALFFCGAALAEAVGAADAQQFTAADGSYSFEVPGDWTLIDSETVAQLFAELVESGQLDEAGVNDYAKALLEQAASFDAYFYAADFLGNMNLGVAESGGFSISELYPYIEPDLYDQYDQAGIAPDVIELATIAGRDCIHTEISYLDTDMVQYMVCSGNMMYTFTFSGSAVAGVDLVMETLAFAE